MAATLAHQQQQTLDSLDTGGKVSQADIRAWFCSDSGGFSALLKAIVFFFLKIVYPCVLFPSENTLQFWQIRGWESFGTDEPFWYQTLRNMKHFSAGLFWFK